MAWHEGVRCACVFVLRSVIREYQELARLNNRVDGRLAQMQYPAIERVLG